MARKYKMPASAKKARPVAPAAVQSRESLPPLLFAILAAGLALRAAHAYFSRQSPFFEPVLLDPAYYHQWALRIAGGVPEKEGVFYGLPLFPYFLALVYKLTGASAVAVKGIQAVLGTATIFFVYLTGRKIASPAAGLAAAALAAFYGPLFFHENILIAENLAVPLYAAAFYAACTFWDGPRAKKGIVLGVLLGLATLTKAGVLPFVAFIVAAAAAGRWGAPKAPRAAAACALAFAAVIAPVTAHNVMRGGDFVLLTSHSGFNFYVGNNPNAEGVFKAPEGTGTNVESIREDSRAIAEAAEDRPLKPSEVSRWWSGRAWEWIGGSPDEFLKLAARKLALFFDAREISDVEDYEFAKRFNPVLRFPWLTFLAIGPLAAVGLAGGFRRLRYRPLIAVWTAAYVLGITFYFVNARYRLPLLGILLPLAGWGACLVWEAAAARRWRALGAYALLAAVMAGVGQMKLVTHDPSKDFTNAGDAMLEQKEFGRALEFYAQAREANPRSVKANVASGIALSRAGRPDEARPFYEKAIEIDPNNSLAWNNLGLWHDSRGEIDSAERCFLKAIEIKPSFPAAYNNLGMAYGKRGDYPRAVEAFERSLRIRPGHPKTLTNLGLVLYRAGRPEEGIRRWREALRADPAFEDALKALRAVGEAP